MNGYILVLAFVALYHWTEGAVVCYTSCEEGQYCQQRECKSCPERTYQTKPVHQRTSCIPWTIKPSYSNFYIVENGSFKSDIKWKCKDGYVQDTENMCILTTTLRITSTTTTVTASSSSRISTTALHKHSQELRSEFIILIICVIVFIIIIIIVFGKRTWNSITNHEHCKIFQNNEQKVDNMYDKIENSNIDQSLSTHKLPADINFTYFLKIIQMLKKDRAIKFLSILEDPSGDFIADNTVSFQMARHKDTETALANSCMKWASMNPNINHKEYVKNARLYVEGKFSTHETYTSEKVKGSLLNGREPGFKKLWYILSENLYSDDCRKLLYNLKNEDENFNATDFFEQKNILENENFVCSFVATLEEWHKRNLDLDVVNSITEILKDIDINDLAEKLKNFVPDIQPEKTK